MRVVITVRSIFTQQNLHPSDPPTTTGLRAKVLPSNTVRFKLEQKLALELELERGLGLELELELQLELELEPKLVLEIELERELRYVSSSSKSLHSSSS